MNLPDKQLFRPIEVAKITGYTRRTIYNWVEQGKLKPERCKMNNNIFIPRSEVEEIIRVSTIIE